MSEANLVLFALLGGTALLLYGVRLVGEGLQRAAGTRLRHVLSTLTGDRFRALLVGAGVTAVLQSSSATTVMLVGFASAGLLSLRQTIGVILGADIGTTVTVQLLAFNLLGFAPLVVFLGWLLYTSFSGTIKYVGQAVLGFGFLFLGMKLIADGTVPLKGSALFGDLFQALVAQPLILFLLAAVFSAVVRSSAATLGIALSFAASGLMNLDGAMPMIFGANVGTAATRNRMSGWATSAWKMSPNSALCLSGTVPSAMSFIPRNRKPKPRTAWPMYLIVPLNDVYRSQPRKTTSGAKPSRLNARSCTVTVVPMSAPRMTPIVWRRLSRPAEVKPTSMTVVALDDCSTAVTPAPTRSARKRSPVSVERTWRSRVPAARCSPSPTSRTPYRRSAVPPRSAKRTRLASLMRRSG